MGKVDRKRLIEVVLSETDTAVATANLTGGLDTAEMAQIAQARALVAIADTLASIDRRLEELVKAVQGIGVTGL